MSRVLLVGKGAPDRGGIPTFIEILRRSELAQQHVLDFLNVAHLSAPEGGKASLGNAGRTLRDVLNVWRSAREHDIVHIHSALAPTVTLLRASLLALAGRCRGCAIIIHAHGSGVEFWLTNRFRALLLKVAMLSAHRVAVVWTNGEWLLKHALGNERVQLIDNGVEIPQELLPFEPNQPPRILYAGLLTARKGIMDLLEASQVLRNDGVEHELWMVGGTPDEGSAAEIPVRAAAAGNALLLGSRPPEEMAGAYGAVDVFCLPSWYEAMPLSVLEAMAYGLPVVATDVGDVSRAVQDGSTGFVVPVRSPQHLALALKTLLTDRELRMRMGSAGRARVLMHFSSAATASAVNSLYASVRPGPP